MTKILTILSLVLSLNSSNTHEQYTSITNIELPTNKNEIKISIEFIAHDLEYHFEKKKNILLKLGGEKEIKSANTIINEYIKRNFYIILNGDKIDLNVLGKEVKSDESLIIYLEKKISKKIQSFIIYNNLLCSTFPNQQNIVHLNGKINSTYVFNQKQIEHEFK